MELEGITLQYIFNLFHAYILLLPFMFRILLIFDTFRQYKLRVRLFLIVKVFSHIIYIQS